MTDEELKALMRATRTEGYPCDLRQLVEAVQALEREECASVAEWILKMPQNDVSAAIRERGMK
jgi:hypothetical protein